MTPQEALNFLDYMSSKCLQLPDPRQVEAVEVLTKIIEDKSHKKVETSVVELSVSVGKDDVIIFRLMHPLSDEFRKREEDRLSREIGIKAVIIDCGLSFEKVAKKIVK